MKLKSSILLIFTMVCFSTAHGQRKFPPNSYNRLGIQAGASYGNVHSKNLEFIDQVGYTVGLSTRATAGENIFFIYGVNFHEFNSSMETYEPRTMEMEEIDFKATGVQINFLVGHKLIKEYLSFEMGPVLQINSKLSPEEGKGNYILRDYDLVASDLEEISRMNFSLAAGISAGLPALKLWLQYQYGLSNLFNKLDYPELREKDPDIPRFKGNMRMVAAGIVFYF